MTTLRRAKLAVLRTAGRLGAFSVAGRSPWRSRRLLILCYHGVSLRDEHECSDEHISVEHLRRRFELLRQLDCAVLPLGAGVERLRGGELPARSVVLTFDDGLYDFKVQAYPLLQEFGYHATVYVPSYYARHSWPVFDIAASYLLWKGRGRPLKTEMFTGADGGVIQVPDDRNERAALVERIRRMAMSRGYSGDEKHALLHTLCNALDLDWDDFVASRIDQLMTPSEHRSLDPRYVDVQLHTHRHRTPRDEVLFTRELDDNVAALESFGLPRSRLQHFCYPSGDVDRMFLPWLRSRGIATATTCEPGLARADGDPLLLPRVIDTMGMTEVEFRAWVSGAAEVLPRRSSKVAPAVTSAERTG